MKVTNEQTHARLLVRYINTHNIERELATQIVPEAPGHRGKVFERNKEIRDFVSLFYLFYSSSLVILVKEI